MIKTGKLEGLKNNIFFAANLMIFSNLINYYLIDSELFDNKWLYSAFILVFSYSIYSLFSDLFINIKDKNLKIKRTKEDAIRYMTIYTIYQLFLIYVEKGIFELSFSWVIKTFIIVTSYISFDYLFIDMVFNLDRYQILYLDFIKIILAEIIGIFVISQEIGFIEISDLVAYLFSYLIWILFTKKILCK